MGTLTDGVQFVRLCKNTGYCLSACENPRGTICPHVQIDGVLFICPHVQIDGVLFVRMCKNDGVLFRRGTICQAPRIRLDWPWRMVLSLSRSLILSSASSYKRKRRDVYCHSLSYKVASEYGQVIFYYILTSQ